MQPISIKQLGAIILLAAVNLLSGSFANAAEIVLSGSLGQCTPQQPCSYRVTKKDIEISGGLFSFEATSTGLCYDQYIVVKRNRQTALAAHMSGTDNHSDSFNVNANDLLNVYVIELPAPHVCIWAGELNWSIAR